MIDDIPDASRTPQEAWLKAAYDVLTEDGVEAVKILTLAKRLNTARSGFYWHFKDRDALLEAMIAHWEARNTDTLVAQCTAYAQTICEAMLNLFDCWLDPTLFDARLDLAIRNWARNDAALQVRLNMADTRRKNAIEAMFLRHGFDPDEASIRAATVFYTQIGYISMQVTEDRDLRISRMAGYVQVFTGNRPTASELDRFAARHAGTRLGPF
ncbi:TetR/AcrR family transcriptional regulator [Rhodobacteraceae bacterium KMM 6894]|nr:TetR/AcrR family transcriptional regulator [Rhodobacteraceae bacterium KMM 6894]